jgi:hypothetical protein
MVPVRGPFNESGPWQIQQADHNSELFYRGAAPLQKKIRTTVDQLKCFQ